jgi:hypothetical protein
MQETSTRDSMRRRRRRTHTVPGMAQDSTVPRTDSTGLHSARAESELKRARRRPAVGVVLEVCAVEDTVS